MGLVAVLAVALVGVVAMLLLVSPRPARLPEGARPLTLGTQTPRFWPPPGFSCPLAQVPDIRVEREADSLVFSRTDTDERIVILWPPGFSARHFHGKGELVAPDGTVVADEGDVISSLAGSAADNGDIHVCMTFGSSPQVRPGEP